MARLSSTRNVVPTIETNRDLYESEFLNERHIRIRFRSENFLTTYTKIPMLINYALQEYKPWLPITYAFKFTLTGVNEEIIHSMYPLIIFHAGVDVTEVDELDTNFSSNYLWEKVSDDTYNLHLHVSAFEADNNIEADFSLYYFNHVLRREI